MRASVAVETSCTMRVLFICAATLACATAVPSGVLLPTAAQAIFSAAVVPPGLPTISPGDIQAAAIDAKVAIEDQARIVADQALLLADQFKEQAQLIIEEQASKINEVNTLIQEKNEEAVWAAEDQKWQALDTLNTSEAQVDGSIAGNAPGLAKSVLSGVIVPGPIITPYAGPLGSPIVYATPGIVAPLFKSLGQPETKPENNKVQTEKAETPTETAADVVTETPIETVSAEKSAEPIETVSAEKSAEQSEAVSTEKAAEPSEAVSTEKSADSAPLGEKLSENLENPTVVAFSQSFRFTDPWPLSPITYFQPGVHPFAGIRQIPGPIPYAPTVIATQWK